MSKKDPSVLFTAEVNENGIVKIRIKNLKEKTVTFKSFQTMINQDIQATSESEDPSQSEVLLPPPNVIYQRKRISDNGNINCDYLSWYPEKIVKVMHGSSTFEVPMPRVLLKFSLVNPKGERGVWTLDTRTIRWFTALSPYPSTYAQQGFERCNVGSDSYLSPLAMPNMYAEGNMCTGGNSIPTRYVDNNLSTLSFLYDLIILSKFNNDLEMKGLRNASNFTALYGSQRPTFSAPSFSCEGWLHFLSKFETFPYDMLAYYKPHGSEPPEQGKLRSQFVKKT